jgi:hypothetical protein
VPYNYTQYVNMLANTLVVSSTNLALSIELPIIIDTAEQRCYRELQLLDTIVRDQSSTLTANSRNFTFPQHFVVSESINVFTPVNTTTTRLQLIPTTREFLDAVYGNEAAVNSPSIPHYYAMITDQSIIVGPPPDADYTLEVVGTVRPTPLSPTNTTTYLTQFLPDLFFAASVSFSAGYLQNYGAQSDNPQMATSWEGTFTALLGSANKEEEMKRYASQAWSAKPPASLATPPRA